MEGFVFVILTLVLTVQAPPPGHPDPHHPDAHPPKDHPPNYHDCHDHDCVLVNNAINNIGSIFDDHLCHVFIHVDCELHRIPNDEQVCASDGQTYDSHCLYAKARCARIVEKHNYYNGMLSNPLSIKNHGPCVLSTVPVTTTTVQTSTSVSSTIPAISTGGGSSTGQSTIPFFSTSLAPASATSTFVTTIQPINIVLGTVFCQYRSAINCGTTLEVVCGSSGNFYPNKCELLKAQCDDPTLTEVPDTSHCSLSP